MPSNHHETCSHPTRTLPHNTAPTSSNADEREPQGSEPRCHTSHQPDTNHQPPGADPALSGSAQEGGRHRRRHKRWGRAPGAPMLRTRTRLSEPGPP